MTAERKTVRRRRARRSAASQRTLIMGIVNVTPNSFSDGGEFLDADAAIAHALELTEQGADIIDVGGESTRPGAPRVSVVDELARVLPVVTALAEKGIRVSVDTMNSETAKQTVAAGAEFINDVSGGLADPDMYRVMAGNEATYIAMHWRGLLGEKDSSALDKLAVYGDVVTDVKNELQQRLAEMIVWGIDPARVIIDPGLGFSKKAEHNWQLLARYDELAALGHPILIGASRKRFLGDLGGDKDNATAIISALSAEAGAWGVRVHNVESTRKALEVASAWTAGRRR
ncbi:dihydropteroate synthase [Diaminobutyricimonas sp. LJ205]|uniref:dihydropteroate synthase n=1 Tax=Diaminobutyricimonas sp. LJ205 TaxID=2683590 RepID=UPI001E2943E5|nr:dihydropteroate synthase [Diaminobutyricimonas sp. LJ205]